MAKFELPIFDPQTGNIEKTLKRDFMPVTTYLKFQKFSENLVGNKFQKDADMFEDLKPYFLEMFPELTEEDYNTKTDVGYILKVFGDVINKSTEFSEGNSKNE